MEDVTKTSIDEKDGDFKGRERLNPWVTRETARLVKIHAAATGRTQGEVIDALARSLPAVTIDGDAA
jgi:hypothetical protein